MSLFRPEELELLICGNPELDFEALEQKSKYEDGYERDDAVIKNLWEVSCAHLVCKCAREKLPVNLHEDPELRTFPASARARKFQ